MQEGNVGLTCKEVFPVLEGWKHLVRFERYPEVYDGTIVALSQDAGTLAFSARVGDEGKRTVLLELAGAVFQLSSDPGDEWEEAYTVFPRSGETITFRKWK